MSNAIKWSHRRIVCELHERGMTLYALARHNGRNPSAFRNVSSRPNAIDEKIIADFLGLQPEVLWPKRYPKTTSRIYDSALHGPLESQKSNAGADMSVAA